MGTLRKVGDGIEVPMPARLVVGRAHTSGLRVQTVVASGEHASIVWTGDHWEIRDLGSTNGTLVNNTRLEPGRPLRIDRGATLMFGGPSETWELSSDAAPDALAVEVGSGEVVVAREHLLALPNASDPKASVYRRASGEWVAECEDGETRPVHNQDVLVVGALSWRLHLPLQLEGTPMVGGRATLATVRLVFQVSRNQEMIDIVMTHRDRTVVLESRGHGYVLLTLARARQDESHLVVNERGWIDRDELLRMLAMDANSLNVAIHRARQQLLGAGIEDAHGLVEVRRGQRRFGTDRFEIVVNA